MSDTPRPLTPTQQRILGVLIEKAKTTPDAYPLSVNALVTGCNQKSNRDPILDLEEYEVQEVLNELQSMGLVEPMHGGRVERWKHTLQASWSISKAELAVVGELLLRGPQTEGELRGRASRMDPIATIEELRDILESLSKQKFVTYLTPPGRRGTVVTHGMHPADELDAHRARAVGLAEAEPRPAGRPGSDSLAELREEVTALRAEVAELRAAVDRLSGGQTP